MKEIGIKKTPGCSWLHVGNRVHTFVAGERGVLHDAPDGIRCWVPRRYPLILLYFFLLLKMF